MKVVLSHVLLKTNFVNVRIKISKSRVLFKAVANIGVNLIY